MKKKYLLVIFSVFQLGMWEVKAQDTLKVVAYNVLHYGDGCQGSNSYLHSLLKTVMGYVNPDILGLVKAQAIKLNSSDFNGLSPVGFADSIIDFALDPATTPGKYAYCTLTDVSRDADGDMDILFYNQNKLGFVSVTNLCSFEEDFDLYKLYYLDTNLSRTHDTTFIYVVLNHTDSGSLTNRDQQDSTVIAGLKTIFYHLPNLISMGDFNMATSTEPGYEDYTMTSDTSFLFYDGPFNPDKKFSYPLDWDKDASCSAYLNTTTRISTIPNSCGATGGAKDWIEHILMSGWLIDSIDYVSYVHNSYTTIGNDGKHFEESINDSTTDPKNVSAPDDVINALFNLSDKYPIMVKLKVNSNVTGAGPTNPVNSVLQLTKSGDNVRVTNPVDDNIKVFIPQNLVGNYGTIRLYDISGRCLAENKINNLPAEVNIPSAVFANGIYILSIQVGQYTNTFKIVKQ